MGIKSKVTPMAFEVEHRVEPTPTRSASKAPVRSTRRAGGGGEAAAPRRYVDFVIAARRVDARRIRVSVPDSLAGPLAKPLTLAFADEEASALRASFQTGVRQGSGRALITQAEAAAIGRRLAEVLLPPPVFRLLALSLAQVLRNGPAGAAGGGLRIRLDLAPALIDLPWEYLYRPDHGAEGGVSGFLLFDPAISLVRLAAAPGGAHAAPIAGRQRLNFVGTFWEGRVDGWEVWREFDQLRRGLKPVETYVQPEFAVASDLDVFDAGIEPETAIFHYAGHVDFDARGRAYCVRELPGSMDLARARKIMLTELAATLRRTQTRLVVLSACNSGLWPAVQPLVAAGMPVVIGINGAIASVSTIEFCTRLYEALGIGLTIDEAVGAARRATMEWGARNGLFDWGLVMVYAQAADAVLFPRSASAAVTKKQTALRHVHDDDVARSVRRARELDGMHFGEIMSRLTERRVLILGRFSKRRLPILQAIKERLLQHPKGYRPELFTYQRPDSRDLVEAILGFAVLSRFVIADLSEGRAVQQELQAIVPMLMSVPVVPIINEGGKEVATFTSSLARRPNVAQPTLRYRNVDDLAVLLDDHVVPAAEALREQMRPT